MTALFRHLSSCHTACVKHLHITPRMSLMIQDIALIFTHFLWSSAYIGYKRIIYVIYIIIYVLMITQYAHIYCGHVLEHWVGVAPVHGSVKWYNLCMLWQDGWSLNPHDRHRRSTRQGATPITWWVHGWSHHGHVTGCMCWAQYSCQNWQPG